MIRVSNATVVRRIRKSTIANALLIILGVLLGFLVGNQLFAQPDALLPEKVAFPMGAVPEPLVDAILSLPIRCVIYIANTPDINMETAVRDTWSVECAEIVYVSTVELSFLIRPHKPTRFIRLPTYTDWRWTSDYLDILRAVSEQPTDAWTMVVSPTSVVVMSNTRRLLAGVNLHSLAFLGRINEKDSYFEFFNPVFYTPSALAAMAKCQIDTLLPESNSVIMTQAGVLACALRDGIKVIHPLDHHGADLIVDMYPTLHHNLTDPWSLSDHAAVLCTKHAQQSLAFHHLNHIVAFGTTGVVEKRKEGQKKRHEPKPSQR